MRSPAIAIIAGYAGVGKTTLGRMISRNEGITLIDKDTITLPWVERMMDEITGNPHDREGEFARGVVRPLEYEILERQIDESIALRTSLIVVAPFTSEITNSAWRTGFIERCAAGGVQPVTVYVTTDNETLRRNVEVRANERDAWKIENWEEYSETIQRVSPDVVDFYITNDGDLNQLAQDAIEIGVRMRLGKP